MMLTIQIRVKHAALFIKRQFYISYWIKKQCGRRKLFLQMYGKFAGFFDVFVNVSVQVPDREDQLMLPYSSR